ncbi:MAG: hypothetical protein J6S23_06875 [Clostridia bacterium]|nr:hypothetical protein [Clostridia bacterium]
MKRVFIITATLMIILVALVFSQVNIYADYNQNLEDEHTYENVYETDNQENSVRSIPGGDNNTDEKWYGVELDNDGVPIFDEDEYVEIDYTQMPELLTHLKPGDIIYEPNGAFIGDIVGHIAMVYDVVYDENRDQHYVIIIESYTDGVTYGLMTPARFESKDVEIYRLTDATKTQIQGAIAWAQTQLGDAWFLKTWKRNASDVDVWYCAELIWAAYFSQGIYLDQDDNNDWGSVVWPAEVAAYENAIPILHDGGDDYEADLNSINDVYHTYSFNGKTYTEEHDYEVYNFCYEKCRACGYQRQAKEHEYTYRYSFLNSADHYAYCECGARKSESHSFNVIGEYKICEECSYRIETNHVHSYTYTPLLKGKSHRKECSCGDSVIEGCYGEAIFGEDAVCRWCGETIKLGLGLLSLENEDALLPNDDKEY